MRDPLNIKMFGATLLSGALSGITLMTVPGAIFVGPGILFGLATAWIFKTSKWLNTVQGFLWVVASSAAWYAAMRMYSANANNSTPNDPLTNMLLAGLVGSIMLAIILSLLIRRDSVINIIVTVVSSVILTVLMDVILTYGSVVIVGGGDSSMSIARFAVAFAIWQVGVGFSLLSYKPRRLR